MKAPLFAASCLCISAFITGCATEQFQTLEPPKTAAAASAQSYQGTRTSISIGTFQNRSGFQRGVFSDGVDRLGGQAHTILIAQLQQTGRFTVLDRSNLSALQQEAQIAQQAQNLQGANYVLTGDVSEFGRKEVGDRQLFGVLGRGKSQIAYATVTLNVVDVHTSKVVYSAQGAGEYSLSHREVVGFGGTASYDQTLNGKVLDLAIREAVDHMVDGIESGAWQPNPTN